MLGQERGLALGPEQEREQRHPRAQGPYGHVQGPIGAYRGLEAPYGPIEAYRGLQRPIEAYRGLQALYGPIEAYRHPMGLERPTATP